MGKRKRRRFALTCARRRRRTREGLEISSRRDCSVVVDVCRDVKSLEQEEGG